MIERREQAAEHEREPRDGKRAGVFALLVGLTHGKHAGEQRHDPGEVPRQLLREINAQKHDGRFFDAREHRQQPDADECEAATQELTEPLPQVLPGAELAQRRQHRAQCERQRRQ